ncbi:MAG: MBL fold metallo-hydrolase [Xanthobacteraceae bacterium]
MHRSAAPLLFAILGFANLAPAVAADSSFRVVLLGSGVPDPSPTRFSASTLIEAGDQKLLIDVGRGATIRLYQLHIPLSKVDVVFFTHYHSDHTIGLPDLLLTGWLPPPFARRTTPLHVIGPTGAKNLLSGLAAAYNADIKGREEEQHLPAEGVAANVEEFAQDGVVYNKGGVKVTAFTVEHGIKPAVGYRIDYDSRSVVLSGDTNVNENVIKHGEVADLLIHEVFAIKQELLKEPAFQKILSIHTTPSQAGTVFTRTHPKLAVYTHIAQFGTPAVSAPSIGEIVNETRQTYQGPLVVGEDLMTFDVGRGGVAVYREAP